MARRRLVYGKSSGWEERHNSMLKMTFGSMNQAQTKNQQERFKHHRKISKISDEEREFRDHNRKRMEAMRNELKAMEAYKKVYQHYSLSRVDPEKEGTRESGERVETNETAGPKTPDPLENNTPLYPFWKIYSKNTTTDISQPENHLDPSKSKRVPGYLQPIRKKSQVAPVNARRISKYQKDEHLLQPDETGPSRKISRTHGHLQMIPRKISTQTVMPQRKISVLEKGCPELDDEVGTVDDAAVNDVKDVTEDDILQMASMSTNSMKKFLGEEAERYLVANLPGTRRQRKIKKLLARDTFPDLVERSKTTSAIFKDYQSLKGKLKSERPKRVSVSDVECEKDRGLVQGPFGLSRNKTVLPSIKIHNSSISEFERP